MYIFVGPMQEWVYRIVLTNAVRKHLCSVLVFLCAFCTIYMFCTSHRNPIFCITHLFFPYQSVWSAGILCASLSGSVHIASLKPRGSWEPPPVLWIRGPALVNTTPQGSAWLGFCPLRPQLGMVLCFLARHLWQLLTASGMQRTLARA